MAIQVPKGIDKRMDALRTAISQIEKQFGKGSIMRLGSDSKLDVHGITTGSLTLDIALGGKGIPRGRVAEVFGPEGSGKSTLCLTVIGHAQKAGGTAAFIDAEHALDPTYARKLGVNLDSLLLSQPNSGEEALEIAEILTRSNTIDVIVVDSVAALVPKAELEGDMGQFQIGLQARLMSQALRKLTAAISKSKTCVMFINQIREKIGVMFGSPETTPGGRALKFYSSVRIDVRRIGHLKDGDVNFGTRVRAHVVKNKIAPPFRKAEFDMLFESGISYEGDLIDLGVEHGVLDRSGSWLSYKDQQIGHGRDKARRLLVEKPDLALQIENDIRAKLDLPLRVHPKNEVTPTQAKPEPKEEAKPEPREKVKAK